MVKRYGLRKARVCRSTPTSLFNAGSFDVILCHNVLEYVDDPAAMLCSTARLIRGSGAILCVLVRNQVGEVLKAALNTGDLLATEDNLAAEWSQESLYGGKVQLFTVGALEAMLKEASLTIVERGVRLVRDYPPPKISRTAEYERIFSVERKLGKRGEFAAVACYTHCLAGCAAARSEGD